MLHIFGKVFDQLFPKAAEVRVVDSLPDDALDELFLVRSFNGTHYLLPYSAEHVRATVRAAKFYQHEGAARHLARQFDQWLSSQTRSYFIMPIPLSRARERQRGHNQVKTVLKFSDALKGIHTIDRNVMRRVKDTKPQSSLKKAERTENLRGAFAVHGNASLTERHVLLLDDVVTTGATMKAAEVALRPLRPASITKLAFAH